MLTIEGYFEGGQFIPDKPVVIPERTKAVVTIEENEAFEREKNKKAWGEFLEAIEKAKDETLEGFPARLKFKTPKEIDAL
jgi:predicted DNA-binding antitoxin AbrB/MazE fold protein